MNQNQSNFFIMTTVSSVFLGVWKWKQDEVFMETHNFSAMVEKVKDQPYVMFVGAPGSGKTATARHIALKLQEEGYEILSINDIKDFETYYDPSNPQVFVIDDVLGKFNLDMKTYAFLNSHKESLLNLTESNTKLILTCREQVYRSKKLLGFFFCKQDNVVLLHDEENALDEEDKRELLRMYETEKDILSSDIPASSLGMFPLLCKLASKRKVRLDLFKSPISCITEELNQMQIENDKHYASLVLLMANQNKLSKDVFDNESNADRERDFVERKKDFLSQCNVSTQLESFMVINALSEMENTYTMHCRGVFTFLHESLFEIVAFHFGQHCPNLMLRYMSSDYVAKYIRVEKEITKDLVNDYSNDLYIKLDESQYRSLAERLYRDVEDGEWSCVFGNVALKNPSVLQSFITLMKEKSYDDLQRVFLSELTEEKGGHKDDKISIDLNDTPSNLNNVIHFLYREGNQRAICWVIYHGHSDILKYIIDQILERNENVDDLFGNPINVHNGPDNKHDESDSVISSMNDEIHRLIFLSSLSDDYSTNDILNDNIDNNSFMRDTYFLSNEEVIEFPGIYYWCKRTIKRKQ